MGNIDSAKETMEFWDNLTYNLRGVIRQAKAGLKNHWIVEPYPENKDKIKEVLQLLNAVEPLCLRALSEAIAVLLTEKEAERPKQTTTKLSELWQEGEQEVVKNFVGNTEDN